MTELKDQLSLLGRKTEYKQDYAPEVLEAFDNKHPETVSYTHLRAHETELHLVCRLLLEKIFF